jgi:hypothetical protein
MIRNSSHTATDGEETYECYSYACTPNGIRAMSVIHSAFTILRHFREKGVSPVPVCQTVRLAVPYKGDTRRLAHRLRPARRPIPVAARENGHAGETDCRLPTRAVPVLSRVSTHPTADSVCSMIPCRNSFENKTADNKRTFHISGSQ